MDDPIRCDEPRASAARRDGAWRSNLRRAAAVLLSLWQIAAASGCQMLWNRGPSEAELARARSLSQQGLAALDQGNWAGAETLLARSLVEAPQDWQARAYYAEALWRRGADRQAAEQLASLPDLKAPDAPSAVRVGGLLLEMDEPELARRLADPQLAAAWAVRGRAWAAMGIHDEALADLNRALDFDSDDESLLFNVAELHRAAGQPERALTTLQHWINLHPPGDEPQQALHLQGLAYAALGRPADAVDSLTAAAHRGPPTAQLLYDLSDALVRSGDPQAARQTLRLALDIDSRHPLCLALLEQLDRRGGSGTGTIFR
jgi:tetratricopeptide (TPR) repeat protein